jgi:DNA integrity scanning protein DisA with diadenylate cyclase activity
MTVTPPLLHQGTMTMKTHPLKRKRLIKIIPLIILAFLTTQTLICCLFHLENHLTLMEKIIYFRVIKCVVIYSIHPSIWEIVESAMHFDSSDNHVFINEKIHKNA